MRVLLKHSIRPAIVLYVIKFVFALIVCVPLTTYLHGIFEYSTLADSRNLAFGGILLMEMMWKLSEVAHIFLPLILFACLLYFVAIQFLYGGIFNYAYYQEHRNGDFFAAAGKYFIGFLKIALAAVPVFLLVLSVADLIGYFFSGLLRIVFGESLNPFVRFLVIYLFFILFIGFIINVRLAQVAAGSGSLRKAAGSALNLIKNKPGRFIVLNGIVGVAVIVWILISARALALMLNMSFTGFSLVLLIFMQQLVILVWSFLEAFQININVKFFKELLYGTELESA